MIEIVYKINVENLTVCLIQAEFQLMIILIFLMTFSRYSLSLCITALDMPQVNTNYLF